MSIIDLLLGKRPVSSPRLVSPDQDFYLPAIGIGAQFEFSVFAHTPNMRRYMPLNYVEVYNPSTTALTARMESVGGELFRIEAGSSRQIPAYFNNIIFTNIGAFVLAANTAIITIKRI